MKAQDKATEFSSSVMPIKEDELKARQNNKPESLKSGYKIGGIYYYQLELLVFCRLLLHLIKQLF
jgi:hypothetical protein